ncbi:MAG: OmpP1/FadL family transporter [Gemmatimonadota bacterium]
MMMKRLKLGAAVAALFVPALASATNGYIPHGYGMKAIGMGGASIAYPQDALAGANNPAGMAMIGNRIDFGLTWFRPTRESEIVGNAMGPAVNGTYDGNGESDFFIPEFGYNRMLNSNLSLGVSVFGNGGMNTSYTKPVPLFGSSNPGVDLMQLFITPTIGYKITPDHAVGLGVNLAYQRFKAHGLENFTAPSGPQQFSAFPGNVTNQGYDDSYGIGVRVGYLGQLTPQFSLGLTYQTKTSMNKLDKYKGLFAEEGGFDIQATYGIGVAFKATPDVNLALDVTKIEYSGIKSINNPLLPNLFQAPLGTPGGAGFAWKDITVVKLGLDWAMRPDLTLRAGYNHGDQPIPATDTFFNILAPGVMKDHYTLGATWTLASKSELTLAAMYAPTVKVTGSNAIPAPFGGGNVNLKMREMQFGVAYGWKF